MATEIIESKLESKIESAIESVEKKLEEDHAKELKKYEDDFKAECDKLIKVTLSTDTPNEWLITSVFKQLNTNKNGIRLTYTGAHWEQIKIGGVWKIVPPVFVKKMFVNELRQAFVRYQIELEEIKKEKTGTFLNSTGLTEVVNSIKKIDDILLALWNSDFHERLLKMCEIQFSVNM